VLRSFFAAATFVAAFGVLAAPPAQAEDLAWPADYDPGCEFIRWGFLGSQERTICDGPKPPTPAPRATTASSNRSNAPGIRNPANSARRIRFHCYPQTAGRNPDFMLIARSKSKSPNEGATSGFRISWAFSVSSAGSGGTHTGR
jgi:hypothetical protein